MFLQHGHLIAIPSARRKCTLEPASEELVEVVFRFAQGVQTKRPYSHIEAPYLRYVCTQGESLGYYPRNLKLDTELVIAKVWIESAGDLLIK